MLNTCFLAQSLEFGYVPGKGYPRDQHWALSSVHFSSKSRLWSQTDLALLPNSWITLARLLNLSKHQFPRAGESQHSRPDCCPWMGLFTRLTLVSIWKLGLQDGSHPEVMRSSQGLSCLYKRRDLPRFPAQSLEFGGVAGRGRLHDQRWALSL